MQATLGAPKQRVGRRATEPTKVQGPSGRELQARQDAVSEQH